MKTIETSKNITAFRDSFIDPGKKIGFVPTMGALHEGHLSLVREAKRSSDFVIVSIFINPTQFNDPNDLKNYPRTLDADLKLLASESTDLAFVPGIHEIYPHPDTRQFDFGDLDKILEGRHRPGHFNGVAQVVSKLFDLVRPHKVYFGQKDFQQVAIIRELVQILNLNVEIISCPIIREPNGLAMSSRNRLLNDEDKQRASQIYKTLRQVTENRNNYSPEKLSEWGMAQLNSSEGLEPEYFSIVNASNLQPVKEWKQKDSILACTAVKINEVRLIDNMFFP